MSRIHLLMLVGVLTVLVAACAPATPAAPTPTITPVPATTTTSQAPAPTSATPSPTTTSTRSAAPATPPSIVRTAPTTTHSKPVTHSRAACLRDENECYEPGTNHRCETGGCVDAARGITRSEKDDATRKWLREHPGYCAVGTQGAVAPCDG
jgi:hypothetical protein